MRKICFVTGTRADYGILSQIMKHIEESPDAILQIIATNSHLSPSLGFTVDEIESDGFRVSKKIPSLVEGDSPSSVVKSMSLVQLGMADALEDLRPDLVVILGDRYEALAAASAAVVFNIPVAHLHGGETTEGAIDDLFRHAITKLSSLHFASTPLYARRIGQMGERPENIFISGAPGAESILTEPLMSKEELEKSLNFSLGSRFVMVAYHPVTNSSDPSENDIAPLLGSLESLIASGYTILFTLSNADAGGETINRQIKEWTRQRNEKSIALPSLGRLRFHSALKHSSLLIGNSSSGLIEAPSVRIPTINIGTRQKGRAKGISVIDTAMNEEDIKNACRIALSPDFREGLENMDIQEINPYYIKDSGRLIADVLINNPIPSSKPFVDIRMQK